MDAINISLEYAGAANILRYWDPEKPCHICVRSLAAPVSRAVCEKALEILKPQRVDLTRRKIYLPEGDIDFRTTLDHHYCRGKTNLMVLWDGEFEMLCEIWPPDVIPSFIQFSIRYYFYKNNVLNIKGECYPDDDKYPEWLTKKYDIEYPFPEEIEHE